MKHINLTKLNKDGLAEFMVTQEGNSHGDQILTLKQHKTWKVGKSIHSQYKIIAITANQEGEWMDLRQMNEWLNSVKRGLK